jgi:hypothetical protein
MVMGGVGLRTGNELVGRFAGGNGSLERLVTIVRNFRQHSLRVWGLTSAVTGHFPTTDRASFARHWHHWHGSRQHTMPGLWKTRMEQETYSNEQGKVVREKTVEVSPIRSALEPALRPRQTGRI